MSDVDHDRRAELAEKFSYLDTIFGSPDNIGMRYVTHFYQCALCFAVVVEPGREGHDAWHLRGQVEVPR